MEYVIHFAAVERLTDVGLQQFKTTVIAQMLDVGLTAGNEIINRNYRITLA